MKQKQDNFAQWAAATGQPLASRAAVEIIKRGGSAIDAAIAADAVLGVVEPMATGIGGDLLAMVVEPDGRCVAYNGTGRASMHLDVLEVQALPGQRIAERSALSITVPGVVRGWWDLHQRYGRLAWQELFIDAIRAAGDGFIVQPITAREWSYFAPVLQVDPDAARCYRAAETPRAGATFINDALARCLRSISVDGPETFYRGQWAEAIADKCLRIGSPIGVDDLASHRGQFVEPLATHFKGMEVYECPPNTQGLGVLEALSVLDRCELHEDQAQTYIDMVMAVERGLEHARSVVTDPSGNTVCTAIVDKEGLAVSFMSSIFKRFGSGLVVPEGGFALQNRGFGFNRVGLLNGAAPGRRPYHTVIPAATKKHGRFHSVFGVVGGAMQPQGHVQLLTQVVAWNKTPQAGIDAPRWRLEGARQLAIEEAMPEEITSALRRAGFGKPPACAGELAGRSDFGGAQMVMRSDEGELLAGSDRRKDGRVAGV